MVAPWVVSELYPGEKLEKFKVPIWEILTVFFKPKSRQLGCEIIVDLYQARHAESNGAIGDS